MHGILKHLSCNFFINIIIDEFLQLIHHRTFFLHLIPQQHPPQEIVGIFPWGKGSLEAVGIFLFIHTPYIEPLFRPLPLIFDYKGMKPCQKRLKDRPCHFHIPCHSVHILFHLGKQLLLPPFPDKDLPSLVIRPFRPFVSQSSFTQTEAVLPDNILLHLPQLFKLQGKLLRLHKTRHINLDIRIEFIMHPPDQLPAFFPDPVFSDLPFQQKHGIINIRPHICLAYPVFSCNIQGFPYDITHGEVINILFPAIHSLSNPRNTDRKQQNPLPILQFNTMSGEILPYFFPVRTEFPPKQFRKENTFHNALVLF